MTKSGHWDDEEMQAIELIWLSKNDWASQVILISKCREEVNFCKDYRELNKKPESDYFFVVHIKGLLVQPGTTKCISFLDLMNRYPWQKEIMVLFPFKFQRLNIPKTGNKMLTGLNYFAIAHLTFSANWDSTLNIRSNVKIRFLNLLSRKEMPKWSKPNSLAGRMKKLWDQIIFGSWSIDNPWLVCTYKENHVLCNLSWG